eukprot:scaffold102379_cov24-Tisochrysis_lutea.AAC.2
MVSMAPFTQPLVRAMEYDEASSAHTLSPAAHLPISSALGEMPDGPLSKGIDGRRTGMLVLTAAQFAVNVFIYFSGLAPFQYALQHSSAT